MTYYTIIYIMTIDTAYILSYKISLQTSTTNVFTSIWNMEYVDSTNTFD